MRPLFDVAPLREAEQQNIHRRQSRCEDCGLYRECRSPRMAPTGQGRKGILVVAEAPGRQEDAQGIQLIGPAGQVLRRALAKCGVDLDQDCWKTNAVACRPPNNRDPKSKEITACRPRVFRLIQRYKPRVILLLGQAAVTSVISPVWQSSAQKLTRWVGWQIPARRPNAWICPTYHPSYLLRSEGDKVLRLWFMRHIRAACNLSGRPWREIPEWSYQILTDPVEAAEAVTGLQKTGLPLTLDYETTTLKPCDHGRILSCALAAADQRAIAFPWAPAVQSAVSSMLKSKNPKIAANLKFEERWTMQVLGHGVRNWVWDTMLAAHLLDQRKGVTGVKFGAFVHFGIPDYSKGVEHAIEGRSRPDRSRSLASNRLIDLDLGTLLQYNAKDVVVEWQLARLQAQQMGMLDRLGVAPTEPSEKVGYLLPIL